MNINYLQMEVVRKLRVHGVNAALKTTALHSAH